MGATKAELWDQLSNCIKILDETFKFSNANSPNFLTMLNVLVPILEGNHIQSTVSELNSFRSILSSLLIKYTLVSSIISELVNVAYPTSKGVDGDALQELYDGMITAGETVKNRAWTHGAITPWASNVGDGNLYRLVYDKTGLQIEAGSYVAGAIKCEIVTDKNGGVISGSEGANIFGNGQVAVDQIELGSVPTGLLSLSATKSEDGKLANASFETYTGTGETLAVTGWTLADNTKLAINTAIWFRNAPSASAGVSLEFTEGAFLNQIA